jgi:hypothetical protein
MKRCWPLALLGLVAISALLRPSPETIFRPALPSDVSQEEVGVPSAGEPSVPLAADAEETPETPEPPTGTVSGTYSPSIRAHLWLARAQNEDGSWGEGPATVGAHTIGRTGITALALLSFLGDAYSHLSRDEYEEQCFGRTVLRGLKWVLQDQQENGAFRSVRAGSLDLAIAAFALQEAYGMTAHPPLKEPAQKALEALLLLQKADGSWGGDGPTAWAMWTLRSAEMNEQPFAPEAKVRAQEYARASRDPGIADSRMAWSRKRTPEEFLLLQNLGAPQSLDFDRLLFGTVAASSFDGPEGSVCVQWREGLRAAVLPAQQADGSWPGGTRSQTVVRSSLALQTLQVYYHHHPAVFSTQR